MALDFMALAHECAPQIAPVTMAAIVRTESGFNPYAIGVVHGRLVRQPSNAAEAIATARALQVKGWNFSVGLAQVNHANWRAYGLTTENAFEPCRNLAAGAAILRNCFAVAWNRRVHADADSGADGQTALLASLSCYASGDFSTGFRTGYVRHVVDNAAELLPSPPAVPANIPIAAVPINSATPIGTARATSGARQPSRHDSNGGNFTSPVTDQRQELDSSAVVF